MNPGTSEKPRINSGRSDLGHWLDYLVARRRPLTWIILTFMALLVILDVLIPTGYGRFPWDSIGGFGALYGFISCVLIIVVSKALGYALLYRPEDYYAAERVPTDAPDATHAPNTTNTTGPSNPADPAPPVDPSR